MSEEQEAIVIREGMVKVWGIPKGCRKSKRVSYSAEGATDEEVLAKLVKLVAEKTASWRHIERYSLIYCTDMTLRQRQGYICREYELFGPSNKEYNWCEVEAKYKHA